LKYILQIKRFLKAGFDINTKNEKGQTALMIVASDPKKDLSLLKYLIDLGADIFIKDNSGKTVEDYCYIYTFSVNN